MDTFRSVFKTLSEHVEVTVVLSLLLVALSIVAGVIMSSIWESTAKSVCFAHHSPTECEPTLRVKTADEVWRLNESYLHCLDSHTSQACAPIYEH